MCKSIGEGGQRCAHHTRPAYDRATFGTPAWDDAAAQFASTPTGWLEMGAERKSLAAAVREWDAANPDSRGGLISERDALEHRWSALGTAIKRGSGISAANKAAAKILDSEKRLSANKSDSLKGLSHMPPVQIDTELSGLFTAQNQAENRLAAEELTVLSNAGLRREDDRPRFRDTRPVGTLDDAIAALRVSTNSSAVQSLTRLTKAREVLAANFAEQEPFHAEYRRRGGWTRAFLVLNSGGHVHRDMNCGTCYPTTSYGWLPEMSGQTENQIVTAAGSDACTACYPTAPVGVLAKPRTVLHATEQQAQAARETKAALKAGKDATKAAKALLAPVPGPHGKIETIAAAKSFLTDAADWPTHPYYTPELVAPVAQALADKTGEPVHVLLDAAAARARKRK